MVQLKLYCNEKCNIMKMPVFLYEILRSYPGSSAIFTKVIWKWQD